MINKELLAFLMTTLLISETDFNPSLAMAFLALISPLDMFPSYSSSTSTSDLVISIFFQEPRVYGNPWPGNMSVLMTVAYTILT